MRARNGRWRGVAGGAAAVALLAGVWLLLGPLQVGGSTSYVLITGTSMEPGLHAGNLVLARAQKSYAVGDAVLYRSSTLHRPVLHRIIVIQDGRYFFKGDNNDFVDPGSEAKSAIVGLRWVRIPWAGTAVGWLARPLHAGLFGGLAALFVLLGGGSGVQISRHRRRRQRGAAAPTPAQLIPTHGTGGPRVDRLAGISSGHAAGALSALLLVGGLMLAVGFTRPTQRTTQLANAYAQNGKFITAAALTRPNAAFPTGIVVTGQPLFFSLVRFVTIRFEYRFTSKLPHSVHGTISLGGTIAADTTYSQHFPVVANKAFTGDTATVTAKVDIQVWKTFLAGLAAQSGQSNPEFRVALQPVVKVSGVVRGTPIDETFQPVMMSIATAALVRLVADAPTVLPGATYKPTVDPIVAALNPIQEGSIPTLVINRVSLLRYSLTVGQLRVGGLAAALAALLGLLLAWIVRKHVGRADDDELFQAQYGALIVPTGSFERSDGPPPVEVENFGGLVRLSRAYQRLILREPHYGHYRYGIEEEGRLYTYDPDGATDHLEPLTIVPAPPQAPPAAAVLPAASTGDAPAVAAPAAEAPAPARPGRREPGWPPFGRSRTRRWLVRPGAALLAVVAVCGLTLGFTASNTVPNTRIGVTVFPVSLSQLAPSQCAGMTFDQLHAATGNSTAGTKDRDLILGRYGTGTKTYTGKQSADCIVAGGGPGTTNNIDGGGGGDICIGAPGARNNFSKCAVTYN